jgi:8-oxoguanine deaminase
MSRLLLRNIFALIVGNGDRLRGVDLLVEGSTIVDIGKHLPRGDAEVIDCSSKLVMPGLINTHHHMFQYLQRAVPVAQDNDLFGWLGQLYPIWQHLTPDGLYCATLAACAELLKTGCTTTADHHYVFPPGLDRELVSIQVEAVRRAGIRFCLLRGSMTCGQSAGGLPPDELVESDDQVLESCEWTLRHHDPSAASMLRVALAPCAPFNVSRELMQETALLARRSGVRLHTHLAETTDEEAYCQQRYGLRPLELMQELQWLGPDVWFAHGIHFSDADLDLVARTGTSIAHCPSSNMRLGSGICRVPELRRRGVTVGLGVDGSASNDTSDMLAELRQCLLLQRLGSGAAGITVEEVFALATEGGASLLGWGDSIARLEVGRLADIVAIDLNRPDLAGSTSDPLAAVLMCGISHQVDTTIVNGRVVVRDGQLVGIDEHELRDRVNHHARQMMQAAGHSTDWML